MTRQLKGLPTKWEKVLANNISDKGLVAAVCKKKKRKEKKTNLLRLNNKKTNNPINIWAKNLNRHFSQNDRHMTKNMKICSIFYSLEKCKSKPQ